MEKNHKIVVNMERYVFIHGSSVGQSAFVPAGAPELICNDIAVKYFQGRTLRQKESAARKAMFVDLYNSSQGIFSVYSFVNNACFGANGREGQYFAISILCKGVYIYPESFYEMLNSAYDTMFKNGKILEHTENGEPKYVISQFNEQKDYLSAFLKKVEEVFDKVVTGEGKVIGPNVMAADYNSWRGLKAGLDVCNSMASYKSLCQVGRLYVSEEYGQSSEKIKTLESTIRSLEAEMLKMDSQIREAKRLSDAKVHSEIEELHSQIKKKDAEIDSLRSETDGYKATIETVRSELEKYAKIGKKISTVQGKEPQHQSKEKKDLLKICLLFLILFFTILSGILNYCFFRNIPTSLEKEKTDTTKVERKSETTEEKSGERKEVTSLVATPNTVEFDNNAGSKEIEIITDGEWSLPSAPTTWISFEKIGEKKLSVHVDSNESTNSRECTFMINAGSLETQIRVNQEGKPRSGQIITYQIEVKDETTGGLLNQGSEVQPGQRLVATVQNPNMANGYGWNFAKCNKSQAGNDRSVNVTVNGKAGETVVIAYGPLGRDNSSKRTKFRLKVKASTGGSILRSDTISAGGNG